MCDCPYPGFNQECDVCDSECECSSCENMDTEFCPIPESPCMDCWHVDGGHSHPVLECPNWNIRSAFRRKDYEQEKEG